MDLICTVDGVDHTVKVKPADLVAFERKFNLPYDDVVKNPRLEHLYFLGWNACRRTGVTDLDFDTWLDKVDDFDQSEAVPLAPSSASSL